MKTYRLATETDIANLVFFVNQAYRGDSSRVGWTTEADLLDGQRIDEKGLLELTLKEQSFILLLLENNKIQACVHLSKVSRADRSDAKYYLGMLTVDPTRQAVGLGKQILDYAEKWVSQNTKLQLIKIEMTVIKQRTELISWYERRGYRKTGEIRPFPYGDIRFGLPKRDDLEFIVLEKQILP